MLAHEILPIWNNTKSAEIDLVDTQSVIFI